MIYRLLCYYKPIFDGWNRGRDLKEYRNTEIRGGIQEYGAEYRNAEIRAEYRVGGRNEYISVTVVIRRTHSMGGGSMASRLVLLLFLLPSFT